MGLKLGSLVVTVPGTEAATLQSHVRGVPSSLLAASRPAAKQHPARDRARARERRQGCVRSSHGGAGMDKGEPQHEFLGCILYFDTKHL